MVKNGCAIIVFALSVLQRGSPLFQRDVRSCTQVHTGVKRHSIQLFLWPTLRFAARWPLFTRRRCGWPSLWIMRSCVSPSALCLLTLPTRTRPLFQRDVRSCTQVHSLPFTGLCAKRGRTESPPASLGKLPSSHAVACKLV